MRRCESYAAWEFVPELSLSAVTDDNLRLLPDVLPDLGNSGRTVLDARATLSSAGNRGGLYFQPRIRAESYSNSADATFDGTDTFMHLRGSHRWEQGELGFRTDYDQQDVRDSELTEATPDDPDIDDPVEPDTGRLLFVNQDRERVGLSPYVDFQLSERSSLLLEAALWDVSYSGIELPGRSAYESQQFAAGIVRQVDARNELSARVLVSKYAADSTRTRPIRSV